MTKIAMSPTVQAYLDKWQKISAEIRGEEAKSSLSLPTLSRETDLDQFNKSSGKKHRETNPALYEENASRILDYIAVHVPTIYKGQLIGKELNGLAGVTITSMNIGLNLKKYCDKHLNKAYDYLDGDTWVAFITSERIYKKMQWLEWFLVKGLQLVEEFEVTEDEKKRRKEKASEFASLIPHIKKFINMFLLGDTEKNIPGITGRITAYANNHGIPRLSIEELEAHYNSKQNSPTASGQTMSGTAEEKLLDSKEDESNALGDAISHPIAPLVNSLNATTALNSKISQESESSTRTQEEEKATHPTNQTAALRTYLATVKAESSLSNHNEDVKIEKKEEVYLSAKEQENPNQTDANNTSTGYVYSLLSGVGSLFTSFLPSIPYGNTNSEPVPMQSQDEIENFINITPASTAHLILSFSTTNKKEEHTIALSEKDETKYVIPEKTRNLTTIVEDDNESSEALRSSKNPVVTGENLLSTDLPHVKQSAPIRNTSPLSSPTHSAEARSLSLSINVPSAEIKGLGSPFSEDNLYDHKYSPIGTPVNHNKTSASETIKLSPEEADRLDLIAELRGYILHLKDDYIEKKKEYKKPLIGSLFNFRASLKMQAAENLLLYVQGKSILFSKKEIQVLKHKTLQDIVQRYERNVQLPAEIVLPGKMARTTTRFIEDLEQYIQKRHKKLAKSNSNYHHFWSSLTGYDARTKLAAASKLVARLKGQTTYTLKEMIYDSLGVPTPKITFDMPIQFSKDELGALNHDDLGDIVKLYQKHLGATAILDLTANASSTRNNPS